MTRTPAIEQVLTPIDFAELFGSPPGDNGIGIALDARRVYATAVSDSGIDSKLYIGQFRDWIDEGDIPPTISQVVAPSTTVTSGDVIEWSVTATDDVAVASVSFYIDGELVATKVNAPWTHRVRAPSGASQIQLHVVARDYAVPSHETATDPITLIILPDPPPEVTLIEPDGSQILYRGQTVDVTAMVSDDLALTGVTLDADSLWSEQFLSEPYTGRFVIPADAPMSVEFRATAWDRAQSSTDSALVTISDAPLTTIVGTVTYNGMPRSAAQVQVLGVPPATTNGAGQFTIPNVTSLYSPVRVSASAHEGLTLLGGAATVIPVPNGTTNAGAIALQVVPSELVHIADTERYIDIELGDVDQDGVTDLVVLSDFYYSFPNPARIVRTSRHSVFALSTSPGPVSTPNRNVGFPAK